MQAAQEQVVDLALRRGAPPDRCLLLAISGPSCSGKTTLASLVVEYAVSAGHQAEVVHFDDYLRAENEYPRRSPEHVGYYEDAFDYQSLISDVSSVAAGLKSQGILIVEGEFLLRREYRELWDVRVWIEVEDALALARGVARDQAFFGSQSEARRIYLERCLPANQLHREIDSPADYADLVLKAEPEGGWSKPR